MNKDNEICLIFNLHQANLFYSLGCKIDDSQPFRKGNNNKICIAFIKDELFTETLQKWHKKEFNI